MKMNTDGELLSAATLQQYQDGLVIAAGNIAALLSQVEFASSENAVIPEEFRRNYLRTLGRVSLLSEDLVKRLSDESDEAQLLMDDSLATAVSSGPAASETTVEGQGYNDEVISGTVPDSQIIPPIESEKAEVSVPVEGRSIMRFSDSLLGQFSRSRRAEYTFDTEIQVVIKDDKSFTLNGERQTLRSHQNGDPSVTIQVLNAMLEASIVGQKQGLSIREIEHAIKNPKATTENIQVTIQRFKKMGLILTVGRSQQTETIYGFPKYIEIKDKRPEPEENADFLDRAPAASSSRVV